MSEPLATLASYVAPPVVRRFAADPAPLARPAGTTLPAAVLFADISGFTALTERLAEQGPRGAEELTRLLNAYFGQLIDLIAAHGGQVAKFAGDALLALWSDDQLPTLARRAAQCALAVQAQLAAFPATGAQALSRGAYREAAAFCREVLRLAEGLPRGEVSAERAGRWEKRLGMALWGVSGLEGAAHPMRRAVALFGRPLLETKGSLLARLAGQALWQALHLALPALMLRRQRDTQAQIAIGLEIIDLCARPRAWLWLGGYAWQRGERARARRHWRRSLAEARRYGMSLEAALAHHEPRGHALLIPARVPARRRSALFRRQLCLTLTAAASLLVSFRYSSWACAPSTLPSPYAKRTHRAVSVQGVCRSAP